MKEELKFQQATVIDTLSPNVAQPSLQSLQQIDPAAVTSDEESQFEQNIAEALKPKKPSRIKQVFVLSLVTAISVETGLSLVESFNQSVWLGGVYLALFGSALALFGGVVWREYRLLRRLKRHNIQRQTAERLLNSEQVGEALEWLSKLDKFSAIDGFDEFKSSLDHHHTDKEVMALYQQTLLLKQDQQAKKVINRFASESGLLVALSPMAFVDMAAVLWRGTKMIEQIARIYGIPLGYASRITLYRSLLKHMLFAGSSELIADIGTTALGAELAGKLSARAGQGISAGILTARLGYKTMELSRPVARLSNKHSLLGETSRYLRDAIINKTALKPD